MQYRQDLLPIVRYQSPQENTVGLRPQKLKVAYFTNIIIAQERDSYKIDSVCARTKAT